MLDPSRRTPFAMPICNTIIRQGKIESLKRRKSRPYISSYILSPMDCTSRRSPKRCPVRMPALVDNISTNRAAFFLSTQHPSAAPCVVRSRSQLLGRARRCMRQTWFLSRRCSRAFQEAPVSFRCLSRSFRGLPVSCALTFLQHATHSHSYSSNSSSFRSTATSAWFR